jgi:hypothetical protein
MMFIDIRAEESSHRGEELTKEDGEERRLVYWILPGGNTAQSRVSEEDRAGWGRVGQDKIRRGSIWQG